MQKYALKTVYGRHTIFQCVGFHRYFSLMSCMSELTELKHCVSSQGNAISLHIFTAACHRNFLAVQRIYSCEVGHSERKEAEPGL